MTNPVHVAKSFYKRVNVSLREFSRKYNEALFSHNRQAILSCLSYVQARTMRGSEVKKTYAIAVKFILKYFFAGQVEIIRSLAEAEEVTFKQQHNTFHSV